MVIGDCVSHFYSLSWKGGSQNDVDEIAREKLGRGLDAEQRLGFVLPLRNLALDDARMVKQDIKFGNCLKRWLHSPMPEFDIMEVANESILPMRGEGTSINDEQAQLPRPPVMRVLNEYSQPRNGMVLHISPTPISHRNRTPCSSICYQQASRER